MLAMKMHERVRHYINDKGLKMNHIAEKSSIELKRFYRIVNGDSIMSADEFECICEGLQLEPEYFFNLSFLETKNKSA